MSTESKTATERRILNVRALPLRKGKAELLIHLEGGRNLTAREAITAKCYECENGYDEPVDCGIPSCPCHPFMPYRTGGVRKTRTLSDEQRQAAADRLSQGRAAKAAESGGAA